MTGERSVPLAGTAGGSGSAVGSFASLFDRLVFGMTLLFVFTVPWENAVRISGVGTISRVVGIPLIVCWLLLVISTGRARRITAFHAAAFGFVFWSTLTFAWSVDFDYTFQQSKTFAQLLASLLIVWSVVDTQARSKLLLQVFVLGSCVTAGFVLYNYAAGNVTRWSRRASISGVDENDVALVLSMCLPIAWYLATSPGPRLRSRAMAMINYAFVPAGLVAIIMTGSRGGFSSTIPFYLYLIYTFRHRSASARLTSVALIGAGIYAVVLFAPEMPLERIMTTIDELNSGGVSGRSTIWLGGLEIWLQSGLKSIFGIGSGGYHAAVGRAAHSTPVSVLVETGIVGLSLFGLALLLLLRLVLKTMPAERAVCLAMLLCWSIGVTALSWEYRKPTWIIWGIVASTAVAFRRPDSRNELIGPTSGT